MTDTRRQAPQTTSSSGYHNDFSSVYESPQFIRRIQPKPILEQSNLSKRKKSTIENYLSLTNNLIRLSSFLRKQYERAKSKLILNKRVPSRITTCSKATSTTALCFLKDSNHTKPLSLIAKKSSFIEPVRINYYQVLFLII